MRRPAFLAILLHLGLAAPAAADQDFSALYVFGDSLSDDGNIPAIISAQNPDLPFAFPVSPPYFEFRFSDGPTYAERLAPLLGMAAQPENNYAVGGAQLDDGNISDQLVETLSGGTVELPGIAEQIEAFVASGGRFESDALVVLYGGGGDYLSFPDLEQADAAEISAFVDTTYGNLESDIRALSAAGAETILVPNIPDLGRSAAFLGEESAAAASMMTAGHNEALNARLGALAAELGIEIVVADFATGFDLVTTEPERFGLSNVTDPCVESAVEGAPAYIFPGEVCSPDELAESLFFDTLHPTSVGHELLAGYAADTLTAPAFVAAEAGLALLAGDAFLRGMATSIGAGTGGLPTPGPGDVAEPQYYSVFVSARTSMGEGGFDGGAADFDYRIASFAGGALFDPMEGVRLGIVGGYDDGEAEPDGPGGAADLRSFRLGAAAAYDRGRLFASAGLAYGFDRYDLVRQTYVPELVSTGTTDGGTFGAFAEAGYRLLAGPVNFGPVASLRFSDTRIDAYSEAGAPGLDMHVGSQSAEALIAGAGLAASAGFAIGETVFASSLALTIEGDLLGGERAIDTALVTVPDIGRTLAVVSSAGAYGRLAAGTAVRFSPRLSADLAGEATFGRDGGDEYAVEGVLMLRF